MTRTVAALGLGVAALAAACGGDSGTPSATPSTPLETPGGLPFSYQATGESSSPSFHVPGDGTYTVTYHLAPAMQAPGCDASLALVSNGGDEKFVIPLPGVSLGAAGVKDGSVPFQLTEGDWRFQEGGTCSWSVTVRQG